MSKFSLFSIKKLYISSCFFCDPLFSQTDFDHTHFEEFLSRVYCLGVCRGGFLSKGLCPGLVRGVYVLEPIKLLQKPVTKKNWDQSIIL